MRLLLLYNGYVIIIIMYAYRQLTKLATYVSLLTDTENVLD